MKNYPVGVKDFKVLVSNNNFFVDKTMMIAGFCDAVDMTFIYTRPRRFGKSLNLSMIDYFFNLYYKDEQDIFKGLKIDSCERCKEYKNRFPVIKMDLGNLDTTSKDSLLKSLACSIQDAVYPFNRLLTDPEVLPVDRNLLQRCLEMRLSDSEVCGAILRISRMLTARYGEKVIILIDEYDGSVHDITDEERLDSISPVLRSFMDQTFKTNPNIRFGVATGVMPLLQVGITTGFNNPVVIDIFSDEGDEYYGFTQSEVEGLLSDAGLHSDTMTEIKEWYDGYRFGSVDVFNPYSVMMYLRSGCQPEGYWNGTTSGGISGDLISKMDVEPMIALKQLYKSHGAIMETPLSSRISYRDAISDDVEPSVVYSYLAMAGYLRAVKTGRRDADGKNIYEVGMVNKEVRQAFSGLVRKAEMLTEEAPVNLRKHIFAMNGDGMAKDLKVLLSGRSMDSTWTHDRYKEFIGGFLDGLRLGAVDEMPKGLGRCDIFIPGRNSVPAVAIEIKTSSTRSPIELSDDAIYDLVIKGYASEPLDHNVIGIGIGIRIKDVHVRVMSLGSRRRPCWLMSYPVSDAVNIP